MNILITGVGGPTPRSFAIALKEYSDYTSYNLFATDIDPLSIGLYQDDLFEESFLIPKATNPDYWNAIEEIVITRGIDAAVILPEVEVQVWSRKMEEDKLPCRAILPDPSIAELLVDKAKMTAVLVDLDVVPPSVKFLRDANTFDLVFDVLNFPFWVRSTSGSSGLGSLKINSEIDLKNWIQINPDVDDFLASKYLPGRNLACKMLYYEGKLLRAACAERVNYVMSKVAPSGITGNTAFGRLLNEPGLVDLVSTAMNKLFNYSGAKKRGFFTVDLKEDENGKPYITEVNIRHVAFTQCFAAGGANLAEDMIRILDRDATFEYDYKYYEFEEGLIFLRDVDSLPIVMKESDLLNVGKIPECIQS